MKRLTITLENYDDSKKVCSSILENAEQSRDTFSILNRSGIDFSIEDVEGDLYHFQLDDGDRYIDLALRTKMEIELWSYQESFEATVKGFLESKDVSIRQALDSKDAYIKINRVLASLR